MINLCLTMSNRKRGFTLLEILVAFTIVGILFVSLYSVYDRVMSINSKVNFQNKYIQNGRMILLQLTRDLESLYRVSNPMDKDPSHSNWSTFSGQTISKINDWFNAPKTLIKFVSTNSLDFRDTFPKRSISEIKYLVKNVSEKTKFYKLIRQERPYPYLKQNSLSTGTKITLTRSMTKLNLTFYAKDQKRPFDQWPPEAVSKSKERNNPPKAIKISFELKNEQGDKFPFRMMWTLPKIKKTFQRRSF